MCPPDHSSSTETIELLDTIAVTGCLELRTGPPPLQVPNLHQPVLGPAHQQHAR